MSAARYTLSRVDRAGVPMDVAEYGEDLGAAVRALMERRATADPHNEHWSVYDADDPERGYFEEEAIS